MPRSPSNDGVGWRGRMTCARGASVHVIYLEQLAQHPERAFRHPMEKKAHRQLRFHLWLRPGIPLPEITATFPAFVTLPTSCHAIFYGDSRK